MAKTNDVIAPGSQVIIRDEEWLVRRIDRTQSGAQMLTVTGLSPLVRDREAKFIDTIEEELDKPVSVVDPNATKPVVDSSPFYRNTRLFLESLLRQSVPADNRLVCGHHGAMDVLPYQLDPACRALKQPRQRILIADAVGLGKTIECGILLSELIRRGRGRRILVLTVKSMMTQFQKELWARFSIPLVRLDSTGLQRVRANIPTNHNPFHYFDKTIISIDTIKQDSEYRNHLENAWWDIIVIDEAHNVARRGTNSLRSRVAELLASRSDSLILLSATPHDGKRESFASIMNMLNPTAIKDENNYGPKDIEGLFIRRFKKDIKNQIRGSFPDRIVRKEPHPAAAAEEAAYACLAALKFQKLDHGERSGALLFKTLIEKALFSSPAACLETIKNRIARLANGDGASLYAADVAALQELTEFLKAIGPNEFAKYQTLLQLLQPKSPKSIGWKPRDTKDRLVIFTERIATLNWLNEHLPKDLGLAPSQVAILHGSMTDVDQQEVVEKFGNEASPVRLLLASDVASEGINLHYQCHRLVHFDIPWSLLTFQQRNGRIDRYGQEQQPELFYLNTESQNEKIRGDQRILDILIQKDQQVQENIGDPSEFTGLYTPEDEEEAVGSAIEKGVKPEEFNQAFGKLAPEEDSFLAALLAGSASTGGHSTSIDQQVAEPISLYQDDYCWAKDAIAFVQSQGKHEMQIDFRDDRQQFQMNLPADLQRRLKRLSAEIMPDNNLWIFTTDRAAVMKDIGLCRKEEQCWPRVHLLWLQHPAMEWLHDKIVFAFDRDQAPVVELPALKAGEAIVLATGITPNRKGHPLIQRWTGFHFKKTVLAETLELKEILARTGFAGKPIPNLATIQDLTAAKQLVGLAVDAMRKELSQARSVFNDSMRPELQKQLDRLASFRDGRTQQLELDLGLRPTQRDIERRKVENLYEEYRTWIRDTLETEDQSSIRIAAIFIGTGKV